MSATGPSRAAASVALGLSLTAIAACVDIVGVENLSAAPPAGIDAGVGGSVGKDGGDSGFSGDTGTITFDGPADVVSEVPLADSEVPDGSDAGDADGSVCPLVRPVQGTACTGTQECVYDACSEATLDYALAACQAGKWAVFAQPCALYPCGTLQCLFPRLLCVSVQGGAASCADNPCISTLSFTASCTCAKDLCQVAPSYQCNPTTTASYTVSCTP